MVVFQDYTVEIRSEGVELPTFDDPELIRGHAAEPNTIVKYIQASAGATFSVFTKVSPTYPFRGCDSIVFHVSSDGTHLDTLRVSVLCAPKLSGRELTGLHSRDSAGQWHLHPLRFGPLSTFEGSRSDSNGLHPEQFADLGCLKVSAYKYSATVVTHTKVTLNRLTSDDEVPEKCLKKAAVDLGTSLGAAHQIQTPTGRTFGTYIGGPLATFKFFYRSKDTLQMLGVLPRSPSPIHLANRPIDELSIEELRELVARQREQGTQNQNGIKKEEAEKKPVIKYEGGDQTDQPIVLADEVSSDDEVVEVVGVSKKRKAEVVDLLDGE